MTICAWKTVHSNRTAKFWPWEWKILLEISLRVAIHLLGRADDPGSKKKKKVRLRKEQEAQPM